MYLLSELWFAFLDRGHHHVTHTRSRQSVQASLDPLHRDDIQIFSSCVVSAVDHGSYRETQGNPEFRTGGPTTSWRLRGPEDSILAPTFAPRSSPCKAADHTRRPLCGLSQSNFNPITAALGAERSRGAQSTIITASCQLNSPGTPATFGAPSRALAVPLLSLSGLEESKAPQLPMAATPRQASSHLATDGEGFPHTEKLTSL